MRKYREYVYLSVRYNGILLKCNKELLINMKKETVNIILTILAIIPATLYMVLSIFGLVHILSNFDIKDTSILVSIVFGLLGYAGLWMNLKQNKPIKAELLNVLFLLLGVIGFVLFSVCEGGTKAWRWIIAMEDPREWLLFVGPVLITLYLLFTKAKRLMVLRKHIN